ncbi:hypothetical protein SLS53_002396 [Cytospora paraplurivora]|uniref:Uncharacterized protein n=1 Tax=Cytospora paraplurivora TaxID=2898453 RepID=A0AAN9UEV5_9PEZI
MLPATSGGSIEFFVGHYPTTTKSTTAAAITTITLTSTSTTVFLGKTAVPALTATSQPVHTTDNTSTHSTTGFTTAAKIGTAVGVTAFGLLVLAALGFILLRRRSQKRDKQQQQEDNNFVAGGDNGIKPPSDDTIDDPYTHNIGLALGDPNEASPVFDPHTHASFELHSNSMQCLPSQVSEANLYNLGSPSTLSSMRIPGGHGSQGREVGHRGEHGDGKAGPSKVSELPLAELPG